MMKSNYFFTCAQLIVFLTLAGHGRVYAKTIESASYLTVETGLLNIYQKTSLFLPPAPYQPAIEPWSYFTFIRRQATHTLKKYNFSLHNDFGVFTANENIASLTAPEQPKVGDASSPRQSLSSTRLLLYRLSLDYSLGQNVFLEGGVLPLRAGESFFLNPVSYFDRRFQARRFFRDYSPSSSPAVRFDYFGDTFSLAVLAAGAVKTEEDIFGFLPYPAAMAKGSLQYGQFFLTMYLFGENAGEERYFGTGATLDANFASAFGAHAQALLSNGFQRYAPKVYRQNSIEYPVFQKDMDMQKQYLELSVGIDYIFARVRFSGVYYYNERGLSENEYDRLIRSLKKRRTVFEPALQNPPALTAEGERYLEFYGDFLSVYDPFLLRRNYLFFQAVRLPANEKFTLGFMLFAEMPGASLIPASYFEYILSDTAVAYFQGSYFSGKAETIFGESPVLFEIAGGLKWRY